MNIEAIPISLNDYVLSGGGANGESYDHKTDPSLMLKLYFPGKITQPLDEMLMARKVFDAGIPTPEPGDYVVTEDGRYGIRFRRIIGKKSYSRATADDPANVDRYASEFAQMCRQLHSIKLDTTQFESVKERYFRLLEENPFFSPREKELLGQFMNDVPDQPIALHGDLQYSNAIFVGDKRYFIDLGDFCYGNPLFDLGMVFVCTNLSGEAFIRETFHMEKALAIEFWRHFVPAYWGGGMSVKEAEELIAPFAGLKTLIIERDTRRPMPEFRAALKSIIG